MSQRDTEIIFAEYSQRRTQGLTPDANCVVKGYRLDNNEFTTYINEALIHNEPEGIFPDGDYTCLESSCDTDFPHSTPYLSDIPC